jgi:arylsulfatase A-like enzyme
VVQVSDALDWISTQEKDNPNKPWFTWLAFNLSHATSSRQPSQMPVPNKDTLDEKSLAEMTACGGKFGTMDTGKCSGESVMRADTNSLDTLLGKLLDQIDKLDPNTYVIVLGDNGTPMYGRPNLDFIDNMYITKKGRGKGTAFESGARVALAIRGPKIPAASRSDEYVHAMDLFSTTLAIAGLKAPERVPTGDGTGTQPLDSVSLAPILFDKAKTVRDPNQGFVLTLPIRSKSIRWPSRKAAPTTRTEPGRRPRPSGTSATSKKPSRKNRSWPRRSRVRFAGPYPAYRATHPPSALTYDFLTAAHATR